DYYCTSYTDSSTWVF
nr:immunoglobulin light chain junction region [Macaca mulatta]MOW28270.1 immunoglobulin light chain junction region [Macaca mulatta]MOW29200.1 immunoglobulin light chain junction region [Macaca mulatta]